MGERRKFFSALAGRFGARSGAPATPCEAPSPPPAVDGAAPAGADPLASVLAAVDRVRPELVRRRALTLGGGAGARAALGRHFDQCDALELSDGGAKAPFGDETFDFIHCDATSVRPGSAVGERWVGEIVRMLRLLGVAAIETPGGVRGHRGATADWPGAGAQGLRLAPQFPATGPRARISAPRAMSVTVGSRLDLAITVENVGLSTWGSGGARELELVAHWAGPDGARRLADAVALPGTLAPGDSFELTLGLSAPVDPGTHLLEVGLEGDDAASAGDGFGPLAIELTALGEARSGPPPATGGEESTHDDELAASVERQGASLLHVGRAEDGGARLYVIAKA